MQRKIEKTPGTITTQVTVWSRTAEMIPTQYGLIAYGEWCRLDCERILASGGKARVVEIDGWDNRPECCVVREFARDHQPPSKQLSPRGSLVIQ